MRRSSGEYAKRSVGPEPGDRGCSDSISWSVHAHDGPLSLGMFASAGRACEMLPSACAVCVAKLEYGCTVA